MNGRRADVDRGVCAPSGTRSSGSATAPSNTPPPHSRLEANVVLLFKAANTAAPDNYRPIALLNGVNKVVAPQRPLFLLAKYSDCVAHCNAQFWTTLGCDTLWCVICPVWLQGRYGGMNGVPMMVL